MIQWKPISGYEGIYMISDQGQVKSLKRETETKRGVKRVVYEKILSPKDTGGYQFVALNKDGKRKDFYIHRLVASVFLDNPNNYNIVNHKDGNPKNNNLDNLEWSNHRQNVIHAYEIGLNSNKGGSHKNAVSIIDKELMKEFSTIKEWAEGRNIAYSTARNIINGQASNVIDIHMIERKVA